MTRLTIEYDELILLAALAALVAAVMADQSATSARREASRTRRDLADAEVIDVDGYEPEPENEEE